MKRARGAHIVIRGLGWKQRERIVDQKWLRVGLCTAGAFRRATTCHGWHTQFARSLARFASFCERVLPLPPRTWPTSQSSFVRSLARLSTLRRRFCFQCSRTGCVRRGPEFHGKSLGYIFTSGAIKAVGVRPFLD